MPNDKNNNGLKKISDALKKAAEEKEKLLGKGPVPLLTPPFEKEKPKPEEPKVEKPEEPKIEKPEVISPVQPPPLEEEKPAPTYEAGIAETIMGAGIDKRIVAYYNSASQAAEQFRVLRTHIFSAETAGTLKAVAVTSSTHNEGKSVASINLAVVIAQNSERPALLIDCNLRKPSIDLLLGLGNEKGLADVLTGRRRLDDVIVSTDIHNLVVVPAGQTSTNPAELLGSQNMKSLLAEARQKFDYVILDTPAVIPYSDPRIIGPLVDGVVIVVRAGKTRREVVSNAESILKDVGAKILGFVLTGIEYYIPEYIHRHL